MFTNQASTQGKIDFFCKVKNEESCPSWMILKMSHLFFSPQKEEELVAILIDSSFKRLSISVLR